jgi:DNA helicase-2/ATP-dependent DNA helicase PcrA
MSAAMRLEDATDLREDKRRAIKAFGASIIKLTARRAENALPLSRFIELVARETGYLGMYEDEGGEEAEMRIENIQELFSVAKKYDSIPLSEALERFLEEVALVADTDELSLGSPAVHLMTLHSAKGLEFPVVFIVGLEEGIFPHSRSALSPADLEEERRLMYVGITRAKAKVYLLYASARMIFGTTQVNPPSRFLAEIPSHLTEEAPYFGGGMLSKHASAIPSNPYAIRSPKKKHLAAIERKEPGGPVLQPDDVRPGDAVVHPQFGGGLIISKDGTLATIAFKKVGVKKMMLGVAPLSRG